MLRAIVDASRALAALDMACLRMPDPSLLINLAPLIEAQASSEIENIVTTNDELFRAASGAFDTLSPATKEAMRYREALRAGFHSLEDRPLTVQTARIVCNTLHGVEMPIRNRPGTFIGNPVTQHRAYTPAQGEGVILDKLGNWERFINDPGQLDPLVAMAVQHYQFEAIHPFFDGNGRTGRILNLLLLKQHGLLSMPVLYLSGYLVRHKDDYYRLLREVTEKDAWEAWVIFMASAVEGSARSALALISCVLEHRDRIETAIRSAHPSFHAAELARILTRQPYARIEHVVEAGLAQRQTASRWLTALAQDGLVERQKVGRDVVFINRDLLTGLFSTDLVGA